MNKLSPQQEAVCYWVLHGESDKQIGKHIGCSVRTVRFHMENAARRLRAVNPDLGGTPRRVIMGYHAKYNRVTAFEIRVAQREQKAA